MKDWDINIYRGVLTGFNDAFIISGEKRQEILNNCTSEDERKRTDELIRPILRGRDIKRYSYEYADLYLIATFPSKHYDIEEYPAVKEYLLSFGMERLEQTGKKYNGFTARKKTNNKWFETQDSISYWDEFNKPKILYPDIMRLPKDKSKMAKYPYFYYDEKGFFPEATLFLMTGEGVKQVFDFLCSEIGFFVFSKFYMGPVFDSTGFRYKKEYLEVLPIPMAKIASSSPQEYEKKLANYLKFSNEECEHINSYKNNL